MGRGRKPSTQGIESGTGYAPPMPTGMNDRAEAKWGEIVPLVAKLVRLNDADADALRQYCDAAVLRERAMDALEDGESLLESGPNGSRYPNPLFKIVNQAETTMQKMAERFGLDPASRKRLAIEAAKAASAFGEFLKRGSRPKPAIEGEESGA